MGLFSFNKDAGAAKTSNISDEAKAEFMESIITKYNLDIENLNIKVDEDKVEVRGKVNDQSVKEKIILAIGNIKGISEVEDFIELQRVEKNEAVTPPNEPKFYTVKKGDSLSKISKEVYGDAMKYKLIFEANKPMLSDPNLIYPGQVLRIPEA